MFKPGDPNGEDRGSVQIPVVMVSLEDGELLGGGGVGDLSVMDLELLKQDFVALAEKESRSAGAEKKSRTASARTTRDNIGPKEDRKSARPPTTEASERPENARSKRVEQALQGVKLKDMLEYLKRDPGFEEMFLRAHPPNPKAFPSRALSPRPCRSARCRTWLRATVLASVCVGALTREGGARDGDQSVWA